MKNISLNRWVKIATIVGVIVAIAAFFITVFTIAPSSRNFDISVNPMQGSVQQAGRTQSTININAIDGYNFPIILNTSNLPSGININFSPQTEESPNRYSSTMSIRVGQDVPADDYILEINGIGGDGTEHSCKYSLTVIHNSIHQPSEPLMIYSDIGIASGDVQVWSGEDLGMSPPVLVNGNYLDQYAPEGDKCFAATSGSGEGNYVGWGVFLGIYEDHVLKTPHTINLSNYEDLSFLVRTSANLKVEIQETNSEGRRSSPVIISNYGWDSNLSNKWQLITIPGNSFRNIDLSEIFCPFMITGIGPNLTFYIDDVKWIP